MRKEVQAFRASGRRIVASTPAMASRHQATFYHAEEVMMLDLLLLVVQLHTISAISMSPSIDCL